MRIRSLLKKNVILHRIGIHINKLYHNHCSRIKSELGAESRKKTFILRSKFNKIKKYENIHFGKRCFIVATGPSLTKQDLELLKNEITLSMNSITLIFDETKWRPTYYGIQDTAVYEKIKNSIDKSNFEEIFVGEPIYRKFPSKNNWVPFPLNYHTHKYGNINYDTKFSPNSYYTVYDGFSITYSLIQIAVYMGFKEIYLLGADTNYKKNQPHHFIDYGLKDPEFLTMGEKMISAHREAKKYADENGIKIINVTRGGMLEVYPRTDLEKALGIEK